MFTLEKKTGLPKVAANLDFQSTGKMTTFQWIIQGSIIFVVFKKMLLSIYPYA